MQGNIHHEWPTGNGITHKRFEPTTALVEQSGGYVYLVILSNYISCQKGHKHNQKHLQKSLPARQSPLGLEPCIVHKVLGKLYFYSQANILRFHCIYQVGCNENNLVQKKTFQSNGKVRVEPR